MAKDMIALQHRISAELNQWMRIQAATLGLSKNELVNRIFEDYRAYVENEAKATDAARDKGRRKH